MGELEKTLNEQISRRRPKRKNLQNMTLDNEDILKLLENDESVPSTQGEQIAETLEKAEGLIREANAKRQEGLYESAIRLYFSGVLVLRNYYGLQSEKVFVSLSNLAGVYREQGDLKNSLLLYQKTLQFMTDDYRLDLDQAYQKYPALAQVINNLGLLHRDQGNYAKAF